MTGQQIAQTTLSQLGRIRMVGGKNVGCDEKGTLTFRFMQGSKNKANHCEIKLNSMDLYEMTFRRIWGNKVTVVSTHEGLYGDMLTDVFETETSLYLSLGF